MGAVHTMFAGIWYSIIVLILVIYLVLDGFELGVGVLCAFVGSEQRHRVMNAGPDGAWNANEIWLVLLVAVLYGAFPRLLGLIAHRLYVPAALIFLGLLGRGLGNALAGRGHGTGLAGPAYAAGSVTAALGQGFVLGGVLQGLQLTGRHAGGAPGDWLTPVAALAALGVVSGYALLGATYLNMKTRGATAGLGRRAARIAALGTMGAAVGVYTRTPHLHSDLTRQWYHLPDFHYPVPLAALAAFILFMLFRILEQRRPQAPFYCSLLILVVLLTILSLGYYPYLVSDTLIAAKGTAPDGTPVIMLTAVGALIPIMLLINGYRHLRGHNHRHALNCTGRQRRV